MHKKTTPILFIAIALIVGACSHGSGERSSTPTSLGTELIISSTLVTLSDAEWERVTTEREKKIEEREGSIPKNERLGGSGFANYSFSPATPEWNTAVIRTAEELKVDTLRFNKCFTSLDLYYDFDKFQLDSIEKVIEFNLKYLFEVIYINWWFSIEGSLYYDRAIESLFSDDISSIRSDLSQEELKEIENWKTTILGNLSEDEAQTLESLPRFFEEVRAVLSGIVGNRSGQSLIEDFVHKTIPSLKEGFVSIGFKSSDAEISEFQDIWAANPEIERSARASLERIEEAEVTLLDNLEQSKDSGHTERSTRFLNDFLILLGIGEYTPERTEQLKPAREKLLRLSAKPLPEGCVRDDDLPWFP